MTSVVRLIKEAELGSVFDDQATKAMGEAFEAACKVLDETGQSSVIYEAVARCIIEIAKSGERDPNQLRDRALTACGHKRLIPLLPQLALRVSNEGIVCHQCAPDSSVIHWYMARKKPAPTPSVNSRLLMLSPRFQDGEKTLLNASTPLLISALLPAFTVNYDVSLCSAPLSAGTLLSRIMELLRRGGGPRHKKKHAFLLIFPSPARSSDAPRPNRMDALHFTRWRHIRGRSMIRTRQ